jgi:type I restriction enzyme S subunit
MTKKAKILKEKDKNKYDLKFLYFQFLSKKIESLGYSRHFKLVKEMFFAIPSLEEQKRIVAKLDNLFAKIDKAIALHQKNIDEANVFMASVLNDVFVELEEKYGLKEINSLFKIKSGNFLPAKNMVEDGEINVYGGNGINGKHNEFNLSGENIIIGRVGALCGNVRCVNDNIWLTDNAFYISEYFEEIDKNFLTQMLIHIDLGSSANKSAQPVISYKSISEMTIPLPPLKTQQKVVSYLDEISQKMEILKRVQNDKMQSLKALKASILDQAFKGEL